MFPIEQGGQSNGTVVTITLFKQMKDANYGIFLTVSNYSGNKDACIANYDDSTKATTKFGVRVKNHANGVYGNTFWWRVCGY